MDPRTDPRLTRPALTAHPGDHTAGLPRAGVVARPARLPERAGDGN
jgi:hypothetical protein